MARQFIVIRKDLDLSFGKYIVQSAHALQRVNADVSYEDGEDPICIALFVRNGKELLDLHQKCLDESVNCGLHIDTNGERDVPTALAVGPDRKALVVTQGLPLVNAKIKWD